MTSPNGHAGHVSVEGVIEARTENGVKINGDWINLSRYRHVGLPDVGAQVKVEVDNRGFICQVENVGPAATPAVLSVKDDRITRLAVLKAAANFLGLMGQSREDVRSDHVLVLADKWLAWVQEPI